MVYTFKFHLCQSLSLSIISLHCFHLSGTVITLEPFLEHRGAVNTVSMETSPRHTLISGLEQLYFSDDEWNLKSWEGFSWWTQLNASNIFRKRGIHIDTGICLVSHQEAFIYFLPKAHFGSACLPMGLLLCLRAVANEQQYPIRFCFTNGYIDLVQLF